jgi:hypothetical protein
LQLCFDIWPTKRHIHHIRHVAVEDNHKSQLTIKVESQWHGIINVIWDLSRSPNQGKTVKSYQCQYWVHILRYIIICFQLGNSCTFDTSMTFFITLPFQICECKYETATSPQCHQQVCNYDSELINMSFMNMPNNNHLWMSK